jgi:hypothetical protein
MCNCRTELTAKLLENVKKQLPDSTGHEVEIGGYSFVFTDSGITGRDCLPVTIKHFVTAKKTGIQKLKTEKTNLLASYCPFCGEKQAAE